MSNHGRFVWYDLMSQNSQAAQDFYTKVVGWTLTPVKGSDPVYNMFTAASGPIGGTMVMPEMAVKAGAPQHWIAYVEVNDLNALCEKAVGLGADVLNPPTVMPGMGQWAILKDPQGAVFASFQAETPHPISNDPIPDGNFVWHELFTDDAVAAKKFYYSLFDWIDSDSMDMGPMGTYQMYKSPGMPYSLGGMMNRPKEMPVSSWLYYIKVTDFDNAMKRVTEFGGQLVSDVQEIPGGERVVPCMDAQGGMFALHGKQTTSF